jgi:hypothetical protein
MAAALPNKFLWEREHLKIAQKLERHRLAQQYAQGELEIKHELQKHELEKLNIHEKIEDCVPVKKEPERTILERERAKYLKEMRDFCDRHHDFARNPELRKIISAYEQNIDKITVRLFLLSAQESDAPKQDPLREKQIAQDALIAQDIGAQETQIAQDALIAQQFAQESGAPQVIKGARPANIMYKVSSTPFEKMSPEEMLNEHTDLIKQLQVNSPYPADLRVAKQRETAVARCQALKLAIEKKFHKDVRASKRS